MRSNHSGVQLVTHELLADTFANPSQLAQSWYPIAPATRVRAGRVASFELFDRRIALYRDRSGHVHALDAQCPHLGADLGQGSVDGDRVRCAFHGWCFGPDGACVEARGYARPPVRRARAYPVQERWGLVWVFNGPSPLFDLPSEGKGRWRALGLPPQRIRCHPHMVLANGLDLSHYDAVHDLAFSESPVLSAPSPYMVRVALRGRPRSLFWRAVTGCARRDIVATFTTIGASVAWASVTSPIVFDVLFTGRPDRTGGCVTRTVFLFERPIGLRWLRGLSVMAALLHDDRRVLETLQFRAQFAEHDEALRLYAAVVNRLGSW
jgi:phenylpropionate dioxygenase-like ring-hydroxylating dioxygenase large terminal subunit